MAQLVLEEANEKKAKQGGPQPKKKQGKAKKKK
jgi:hypothetical protein